MKHLLLSLGCLWFFATAAQGQSVVINEYFNSGGASGAGDMIELLVISDNLDMRGMTIKDYSSSNANDNGGGYVFSNDALWSNLSAGTLIVLVKDTSANDLSATDFILNVGLQNATYFTALSGTFDIATTDMLQLKAAGSDRAGHVGHIHALGTGTGTQWTSAPNPKLAGTGTSGTATPYMIAGNANFNLTDFDGNDAASAASGTIGAANNANNLAYIQVLNGTPVTLSEFSVE